MPRFFFHVFNGNGETKDDEGLEVANQSGARQVAIDSIRSIVSEEARQGTIDLDGRIAIEDGTRNVLLEVAFIEAFDLNLPEDFSR